MPTSWVVPTSAGAVPGGYGEDVAAAFLRACDAQLRHAVRVRRGVVVAMAVLLAVALAAAAFGWDRSLAAIENERAAVAGQRQAVARDLLSQAELRRDTDPRGSLQRAIAADRTAPSAEAATSIVNTLTQTGYAGMFTAHQGRWTRWRSPRTAAPWPPAAPTTR